MGKKGIHPVLSRGEYVQYPKERRLLYNVCYLKGSEPEWSNPKLCVGNPSNSPKMQ